MGWSMPSIGTILSSVLGNFTVSSPLPHCMILVVAVIHFFRSRVNASLISSSFIRAATLQKCGVKLFSVFSAKGVVKFGVKFW